MRTGIRDVSAGKGALRREGTEPRGKERGERGKMERREGKVERERAK